jgi:hypothetical protein
MQRLSAVLVVLAFASQAHADSVDYVIMGPSGLTDCRFLETGTYTVYALLNLTEPAKSLQLSAPTRCGGSGMTWNHPLSGSAGAILTVDFGECVSGTVSLFSAQFDVDMNCCPALLQGPIVSGPRENTTGPDRL